MHERLTPNEAVQFCKEAEQYRMFFLEDPLSPEDLGYFRQIRENCATPIAMANSSTARMSGSRWITGQLIDTFACMCRRRAVLAPRARLPFSPNSLA